MIDLKICAELSTIAYKKNNRIKEEIERVFYNSKKIHVIREVQDLKYFIVKYKKTTYIAIRGTNNLKNWLRDFNVDLEGQGKDKTHEGFERAMMIVYQDIICNNYISKEENVVITGHSLGAAISHELADLLKVIGFNIKKVISFGCPGTGNKTHIKNSLKLDIQRVNVLNDRDIIFRMPPGFMKYSRYPVTIFYDNAGKRYVNPSFLKINFLRVIASIKERLGTLEELFEDHSMKYYRRLILS